MNGEPQVVLKGTSTIAGSCTTLLSVFHKLINMFGGNKKNIKIYNIYKINFNDISEKIK